MKITLIVLGSILVVWIAWSYFGTRNVERPRILSSTVLSGGIELREVAPMIQANVVVAGSQQEAINNGFRQLAGYIFGGNTVKTPVAMTAPVALSKTNASIAMTAPVAAQQQGDTYRISFMMPSKYTLATLPKPNNSNISFVEIPAKKYYVWKFSGYATELAAKKQLDLFMKALSKNNMKGTSEPVLNQYNDPWTIPFMRTNEWWIQAD